MTGCEAARQAVPPAIDLSADKCPPASPRALANIEARVQPPAPPVSRQQTADWIDKLRADVVRKRAAGRELAKLVEKCREPVDGWAPVLTASGSMPQ